MSKYSPYSRRRLRALFGAWVSTHRRLIASVCLVAVALIAGESALLLILWNAPARNYVLGIMHAATLAALAQLVMSAFFAHNREAIGQLRGAWGEDNTRNELQRAKRKGLIWGSVDSVDLQVGDIDHLVVTRRGGLVAIDSKWRAESFTDTDEIIRAANRVRARAEGVARTVLDRDRGAHRASSNPSKVRPVIVLWGTSQHTIPEGATKDGIDFVAGKNLVAWLAKLDGAPIDKDYATDLLGKIRGFRASAWGQERTIRH